MNAPAASGGGRAPDSGVALTEMRWWHIDPVLLLEHRLFPEDAWSAGMFWSELAHARGPERTRHYVVATTPEGALAGYAGLAAAGITGDVQTIAAAPEHQGTGLGSRLLRELLGAASTFGCQEVFLEVRTDNEPAQRLYRRYGFEPVGIRRNYYQAAGQDALVMRLDHTEPLRDERTGSTAGHRTAGDRDADRRHRARPGG